MLLHEAEVTSWLSNLIKWNYIKLESENRRVIDSDHSPKNPLLGQKVTKARQEEIDAQSLETGGFQEGVKAANYDDILKKEREEIEIEKNHVLSEARKQADELVVQARTASESIKDDAYKSGYDSGLAAGKAAAEEFLEKEKEKLARYQEELEASYQEQLRQTEPQIAEFMIKMIEKLTGAVVKNRKNVILYLVKNGLEQTGKSSQFIIRVSSEDFPVVEAKKEKFLSFIDGQGELFVREDKGLSKNQCVIETDTAIIESSLDVQMKNLIEDIRLAALRVDM